ncbi:T9SS type A sorting domain-containing protein [Fulvivirga sedimenti]|uniref:T9SS type A sorting domain-containing protein n=1 Tax=Fulvivirga sedimenti TaxID=2879465 RepID=A0A9X1L0R8_9BACT|nr:T9SS type A sorting domain-containing protein [Fulvivirga sedimenti]MCA6078064.1 T9SS type A sorting domain-containing protein [Fulvivirga sedimenti]
MRYFLAAVLTLLAGLTFAQRQNTTGNWNNSGNWQGGNIGDNISESVDLAGGITSTIVSGDNYTIGDLTFANGAKLYINTGGILIIGSSGNLGFLETNNNAEIYVNGTLEIFGDLNVNNNLVIQVTGNFIIHGNVDLRNNSNFSISGSMVVDGDFIANNNTDFTVNGSVDIGGDISVGSGNLNLGPGGSFTVGGSCSWTTNICNQILPVELLNFAARPVGEAVLVSWATATEKDNDYFRVQVSRDGSEFSELTRIKGAGDSEQKLEYEFTDYNPMPGTSYYRLSQTDYSGITTIFTPVKVDRGFEGDIGIYPNPASTTDRIQLFTGGNESDQVAVVLYSVSGTVVWKDSFEGNHLELMVPESVERGTYLLEVRSGSLRKLHRLVLK